ncbi:MAG: lytic transglycosylase domain-containing protein [Acidimicrobiia bacterium]
MADTLLTRPTSRSRHRRRRTAAALGAAFGVLAAFTPMGRGTEVSAADTLLDVEDPSSTVLAELNTVAVTGGGVSAAEAEVRGVLGAIDDAVAAHAGAVDREAELAGQLLALQAETARLNGLRDDAIIARNAARAEAEAARLRAESHQAEADAAQAVLDEVALEAFMAGGDVQDVIGSPGFTPAGRKVRYLTDVLDDQLARQGDEIRARAQALAEQEAATVRGDGQEALRLDLEAQLQANAAAIATNGTDAAGARQAQLDALAEQDRLGGVLIDAKASLADARRTGTVVGADFPLVVLDAFVRAVRYEASARPACALDWTLLAAISRVESGHGTYGGSRVDALGWTSSILGPQLAPGSGFATIEDTDGGALDGDPLYDRAVGPMQFIPSSWRIYALDGDDDGSIDPLNYYDAALAAAEHLCRGGADTSTAAGRRQAVLSYNNSESYLATVLSLAARYGALSIAPT